MISGATLEKLLARVVIKGVDGEVTVTEQADGSFSVGLAAGAGGTRVRGVRNGAVITLEIQALEVPNEV